VGYLSTLCPPVPSKSHANCLGIGTNIYIYIFAVGQIPENTVFYKDILIPHTIRRITGQLQKISGAGEHLNYS